MQAALVPVGGDPVTARSLADVLAGQAEWVGRLERVLGGLAEPDVVGWEGPAGRAFAQAARRQAPVLRRVARRCAVAAAVVRRLADVLEQVQAECDAAQRVHAESREHVVALGEARVVAESSGDPAASASVPRLTADLVAAGERVAASERRHAAAWEAYREVDRSCAVVLARLLDDGLADPAVYDALTATAAVAEGVAAVAAVPAAVPAPPLRVFDVVETAATGVALGTRGLVRLAYGDGDLGSLALAGLAGAAGPAASVLKRGAAATNPAAAAAATRAERRGLRLSPVQRLQVGLATRGPVSASRPPVPWTRPPRGVVALRRWALDQAEARVAATVRRRWLDDLDTVTRRPGASTPMLVGAFGTEAAGAGAGRWADSRATGERDRVDAQRAEVGDRHGPVPR